MGDQARAQVGILGFTDITNRGQGGLLQGVRSARHILDENVHQIGPLVAGQLDGSNRDNKSGSSISRLGVGRVQGLEGKLLDL